MVGKHRHWLYVKALTLTSCVTLDKIMNSNENNSSYLSVTLRSYQTKKKKRSYQTKYVRFLAQGTCHLASSLAGTKREKLREGQSG